MSVEIPSPTGFRADLRCVTVGAVTIAHGTGGAIRCIHGKSEISRGTQRNYHLVLNRKSSWTLRHRGDTLVRAGEAVIMDSAFEYDMKLTPFDDTHIHVTDQWIRQWVRDPSQVAGRVIHMDSGWGAALCTYVKMLTPAVLCRAPLPASVIVEHIGTLLALVAHDTGRGEVEFPRRDRDLRERILETVRQRSPETGLTAADVATSVGISTRTLHRHLAAFNHTFAAVLIDVRVANAMRMLQSRAFRRVTVEQIAHRTGFSDASHFARIIRARSGRAPHQIRPPR
jgi:AraC-like DNA-binding protein